MRKKNSFKADQLAERLDFKQVSNSAIHQAIALCCEYSLQEIKAHDRKRELVFWRHAILCCFAMNKNKTERVGYMFNRHHTTVMHSINEAHKELDVNCKDGIVGNIRLLMHYAEKQQAIMDEQRIGVYCNEVKFKIEVV